MSFSLGPKGGLQDPELLRLLAELTTLVKSHGFKSSEVSALIKANADKTFVDSHSMHMHTFKEIAEALGPLIEGIKMDDRIPGDTWQEGSIEDIFKDKDPDEPADWWKS